MSDQKPIVPISPTEIKTEPGEEADGPKPSTFITIRVLGQDGSSIHMYLKRTTKMEKLMREYSSRIGIRDVRTLNFRYDGCRVNDDDTAESLDMEDGDEIEVFQRQTGGGRLIE